MQIPVIAAQAAIETAEIVKRLGVSVCPSASGCHSPSIKSTKATASLIPSIGEAFAKPPVIPAKVGIQKNDKESEFNLGRH